jgi:hypothetical protein
MIPSKGYAVQDATTDLAPWNFERRELGPHDVQFDIHFVEFATVIASNKKRLGWLYLSNGSRTRNCGESSSSR